MFRKNFNFCFISLNIVFSCFFIFSADANNNINLPCKQYNSKSKLEIINSAKKLSFNNKGKFIISVFTGITSITGTINQNKNN